MIKSVLPLALLGLCSAAPLLAAEKSKIEFQNAQIFYEFGTIVKGVELALDTIDNMWNQRFGGTFGVQASKGDNLHLYLGAGSIFWHAIPAIANQSGTRVYYGDAVLTKAYAEYDFGGSDSPDLVAKLGFIPVKYSNSKNLGEYLFRTGTYPSFLVTGNGYTVVNTAEEKVLGTQWSQRLGDHFSHDLFFTSERSSYPLHDFSLTYLAKYQTEFLKLSLGVQFDRLIPVTPSLTTPGEEKNTYFTYQGQTYTNNPEFYNYRATAAGLKGNAAEEAKWKAQADLIDSLRAVWEASPELKPKLEKYSFKGIKPLAMVSLDFKALLDNDLFRGEEMLLYSEAVLMGWENRPVYYENRMDRLAVMVGFNFPTFGLLDICNVEVERLSAKFVNGYRNAREGNLPLPDYNYDVLVGYDPEDWKGDDWKWSVFLGRKIVDGFQVQAQVASDHLRGRRFTRVVSENSLLVDKDQWYYAVKLQANL